MASSDNFAIGSVEKKKNKNKKTEYYQQNFSKCRININFLITIYTETQQESRN